MEERRNVEAQVEGEYVNIYIYIYLYMLVKSFASPLAPGISVRILNLQSGDSVTSTRESLTLKFTILFFLFPYSILSLYSLSLFLPRTYTHMASHKLTYYGVRLMGVHHCRFMHILHLCYTSNFFFTWFHCFPFFFFKEKI